MSLLRALFARLRHDESGFTLIEVLVSAAVVVLVSVGVLKTLDAAANRSGEQKSKSVGAGLAQQDQERLRAFRAQELNNYTETRTQTVGNQAYRIVSRTDWVSDQSGTRACGTGARADYLRISSTVIWRAADDAETGPPKGPEQRVSLASVVAPRVGSFGDQGSLAIEIVNRSGVGRPNVPVSVTGPKDLTGATDQNGCLFFGYLPEGNYTVNVSQPGLIDANGNTSVSKPFGVIDGSITSAVIELDLAATLDVTFRSKKGGTVVTNQKADAVSISHSGLAAPGWRTIPWTTVNVPQTSFPLTNLFPFTSPYSVYSGNCPGNNPSFYGLSWGANQFATLSPGGASSITVHEPAVRLNPGGSGGTAWPSGSIPSGAIVALKPETTWLSQPTYCSETKYFWTRKDGSSGTGAWLTNFYAPSPYDFGVPVGAYDMCVVFDDGSGWKYRSVSNPAALQPLDDGPTGTNASVTVAKPTSTTSCL
jgi:prepilin-type N-terminal cleavage/methylation domain-containing protein